MKPHEEDEKMRELFFKIGRIECELGIAYEETRRFFGVEPSLLSVGERNRLEEERQKLLDDFYLLLIELDRINIRYTPEMKLLVKMWRSIVVVYSNFDELKKDYGSEILDYHENGGILERGVFLENYYKLKPPYVRIGTHIPQGIKNIYHESRLCYVFAQYSASIALSRTVIETVLKHKFNLEGELKKTIEQAIAKGLISNRSGWNAHKVRMLANKILHKANSGTEKQAIECLDHLLSFIEEVYFD